MAEICIVTKAWRYSSAWLTHSIARGLTEIGTNVCLISPASDPQWREVTSPLMRRVMIPREHVTPVSKPKRVIASMSRIVSSLWHTLAERRRTRTFLFMIPEPLPFTLPLFALLRLSGAHVMFLVHDAVPHAWRLSGWKRRVERAAHHLSFRLASEIVVLTEALRRPLEQDFGIPADKIIVIPHGPLGLGDLPPPSGSGRLLQFGSLRRNKSLLEVIEGVILARREGQRVSLVIAGEPLPAEGGYWQECLARIAQDPAGFEVHEGFQPDSAVPDLVAGVDAFMLAYTRFESQSGVGVLAATSGRPVICTAVGGVQDLIAEGLCHQPIAEPVSAQSVRQALEAYAARPFEEWRAEAAAATANFARTMSWQAIARRYAARIV